MMNLKSNDLGSSIKESILYLVFRTLTTALYIALYWFFTRALQLGYYAAYISSWFGVVTFVYTTNKLIVFSDNGNPIKTVAFYLTLLFSFAVETGTVYVMIEWLPVNDIATKIAVKITVM